MICGNDPRVKLTPSDREAVERFKALLVRSKQEQDERDAEASDDYPKEADRDD